MAVPTIKERGNAWEGVRDRYVARTPGKVEVVPAYREGGWCAGLNEVWEKADADYLVCGSDDMVPEMGWWLPLKFYMDQGYYTAPAVISDGVTDWGGFSKSVLDGTPTRMSTFPVLKREWWDIVFPLPHLHYYGDNLIADLLRDAGIECVAVCSSKITHHPDDRGRKTRNDDKYIYEKVRS